MRKITITEALAELKTLEKRIEKKRAMVKGNLFRQEQFKDPLLAAGGSEKALKEEAQAITDLENNIVAIRVAILKSNLETAIDVCGVARTVAGWLAWRRDVAPKRREHLAILAGALTTARQQAAKNGLAVHATADTAKTGDVIVHIDEAGLHADIEQIETVLGTLDGQLSLKNATVQIDIP